MSAFILAASPRRGGNCDAAARLFAQGFAEEGRIDPPAPVPLRDYRVQPCVSCGACSRAAETGSLFLPELDTPPIMAGESASSDTPLSPARLPAFGCPQTARDDSLPLLTALLTAPVLCMAAPIYFYHIPAAFKALIDRTQPFWALDEARDARLAALRPRVCHVILVAARERGEQLFSGALLTLRQAFKPLRVTLAEPLLLRGLDAAEDLVSRTDAAQAVVAYGREAGRSAKPL